MLDMLLRITLPEQEICVESKDSSAVADLYKCPEMEVVLEHSLYTISLWESQKHKAFLKEEKLTNQDFVDYIRCMIVSPDNISEPDFIRLTRDPRNRKLIDEYIHDKKSATCFFDGVSDKEEKHSKSESSTAEVLYYSIFSLRIPIDVEHWHLNKLLALLKVFDIKNPYKNQKKRTPQNIMKDYNALNEARKKKYHTRG